MANKGYLDWMMGSDYSSGGSSSSGGGWGDYDWIGAVLGGLESYANSREDKEREDQRGRWALRATREQGRQSRLGTAYEAGLADYYRQLERERRRQGFSNFGQFSSRQYNQTYTPPPVGAPPSPDEADPNYDPRTGEYLEKPRTGGGLAGMARGGG